MRNYLHVFYESTCLWKYEQMNWSSLPPSGNSSPFYQNFVPKLWPCLNFKATFIIPNAHHNFLLITKIP